MNRRVAQVIGATASGVCGRAGAVDATAGHVFGACRGAAHRAGYRFTQAFEAFLQRTCRAGDGTAGPVERAVGLLRETLGDAGVAAAAAQVRADIGAGGLEVHGVCSWLGLHSQALPALAPTLG